MSRRGRSRGWVLLAALLGASLTASLGVWQLGRADLKLGLLAQREAREALPAVDWEALPEAGARADWSQWHDRPVRLRGRWVHGATLFLDNRPMQGRSGFFVVTPLQPRPGAPALLVQRGWVPRDAHDRTAVPALPQGDEPVEVVARLAPPPSRLYEFAPDSPGRIRQNVDLAALAQEMSLPLYPLSALQTDPENGADGLLRDWPRVGADVHKHYGYALQWFGLCALILILYVWFQFIAPRRQRA